MANLGLGGTSGSGSRGRNPSVTGAQVQDSMGGTVTPGLKGPMGMKYEPYGGTGRVPDTRTPTWDQVGVPPGSSLVIGTNAGRTTVPYSPLNTYSQLEQIMSGAQRADNKPMNTPRSNLTSVQKFLIRTGAMSASDIDSQADWGNPAHEKTREALLKLMQQGNYSGYSWAEVAAGAGLPSRMRNMLQQDNGSGSGSGPGGGSTGPFTQVRKDVGLSNRRDARALLRATMQSMLGRTPTKEEVGQFLATLNREEREQPTVTTTVSQEGDTSRSDSTTTESGINRDMFAESYVQEEFSGEASRFEGDNYELMILNAIGGA